jgi:hypothetical protein
MIQEPAVPVIRSLLCHRDVDMAIACLGSLLRFSRDPLQFVLHEDGTLTRADADRLSQAFPGLRVVFRSAADAIVNERLARYPYCSQYRKSQAFALKLLDAPLLSEGDLAFCDSDILFFRPFRDLFRWPDQDTSMIFMSDCREAYSVRPWDLIGRDRIRLPSRVNSGLFVLRQTAYDLDFMEWCLGRAEFRQLSIWIEQTCWAALASRVTSRQWDERQVAVMRPGLDLEGKVAVHFTSRVRSFLPGAIAAAQRAVVRGDPVVVRTEAAQACSPLALTGSQIRHACGLLRNVCVGRFRNAVRKVALP